MHARRDGDQDDRLLGYPAYRWGGFRYTDDRSIPDQLEEISPRVRELAAVNKQYGVCAMYHTPRGRDKWAPPSGISITY